MMIAQWKKFTGSDEQVSEILNAKDDVKLKYTDGGEGLFSFLTKGMIKRINIQAEGITDYLICQPHTHAEMIIEWARTGRQVFEYDNKLDCWINLINPSWDHETKYSFNPDGDGK